MQHKYNIVYNVEHSVNILTPWILSGKDTLKRYLIIKGVITIFISFMNKCIHYLFVTIQRGILSTYSVA